MSDLFALQDAMAKAIRYGHGFDQVQRLVKDSGKLTVKRRLQIYSDSANAVLINTLKSIYPVCQALVGAEFFSALCYRYIAQTPSTSPNLNDYGHSFEWFLKEFEPAQQLPYLPDVARLEWAWHRLSFAHQHAPAHWTGLVGKSEQQLEALILSIPTDAVFVVSDYPLLSMWELCEGGDEPEIDLGAGGVRLLLYRDQCGRQMAPLSQAEYFLLRRIASGERFGLVGEKYLQQAFEADFTAVFARCCQQGWVSFED